MAAPYSRQSSSLSSLDAAAITVAPISAPSSTAASPTPPAAPSTRRVSPGCRWARSFKRVVRRAVGIEECRRGSEVDAVGNRDQRTRIHRDLLGETTPAGRRKDPIADGDAVDAGADRAHDARDLGAGRERQRRLELVQVLDDQDVGEVHRAGLDVDDDLTVTGGRIVDVLDRQRLGRPELATEDCSHGGHRSNRRRRSSAGERAILRCPSCRFHAFHGSWRYQSWVQTTAPPAGPNSESPSRQAARTAPSLGYQPALDGLRALAVLGVLLYHARVSWAPGGFLGVDAFFVLSGFLITSLLVDEWRKHGRIDLRAFWVRRARRLLPALVLVVIAVGAYACSSPARTSSTGSRRHVRIAAVRRQLAPAVRVVLLRAAGDAVTAPPYVVARHRRAVVPRVAARPVARAAVHAVAPVDGDRPDGRGSRSARRS